MVEAPARLEASAIAARDRKRHVGELDHAAIAAHSPAIADADPPRPPIRVTPEGAELAEIDDRALEAFVTQEVGNGISDIALRQAVERNRHASAGEADRGRAGLDAAEVDERLRHVTRARGDIHLHIGARPEMRLVELPQRLHRDVEGTSAERTDALALLDQRAQLGRGSLEPSTVIEARDLAVRPIEAEDALVALDLQAHLADRALCEGRVGVPQGELRDGTEHLALPAVQLALRRARAHRRDHQRHAGCRRHDAQGAPARRVYGLAVTHGPPPRPQALPPWRHRATWRPTPAAGSACRHNIRPDSRGTGSIPRS